MLSKGLLLVAVVGALLVGGAVTGTTYASWRDTDTMSSSSVATGQMSFTAGTPGAVTMATSSIATTSITLDDTSVGKNLAQRLTVSVGSTPAGVTATVGTSCPGAASAQVDTTPGASRTLCIRLATGATASSGTVTLTTSGAQRPSGWSTPTQVRAVAVTVTQPPGAPTLGCSPGRSSNTSFVLSWSPVPGATGYTVHRSTTTNADAGYSVVATLAGSPPATSHEAFDFPDGATYFFRVRAVNGSGTSLSSNTIRVTRSGNGNGNFSCAVVTP